MKREKKRIRTPAQIQQRARELCREMTPAEKILWQQLRNQQLSELKFRRQHPLGPFIADFYCAACRLVVEVDGDIHDRQPTPIDQPLVLRAQIEEMNERTTILTCSLFEKGKREECARGEVVAVRVASAWLEATEPESSGKSCAVESQTAG